MTVGQGSFLPDSLRPQPKAPPRSRRGFRIRLGFSLVLLAAAVWVASDWRLSTVSVRGCQGMPASVTEDLEAFKGLWVPTVDLAWVGRHAEQWPGVGAVDVELRLPGTLVVRAVDEEICGSIPVGSGWRGVSCEGRPGRRIDQPHTPILIGFGPDETKLRRGLSVGKRLAGGHQDTVLSIRKVAPLDLEVSLGARTGDNQAVTVRVLPGGSPAEEWGQRERARGKEPRWADLRFEDRVVVGGLG